ncbi:MAG: M3 family metallopeptidase [Candidatus Amulumruptor caecigallinarius]|nr:M3 family metallopeptidase [Candidatus Amulumruptor caecigallinarius]
MITNIEAKAENPLITGKYGDYGTMPLSKLTAADYEEGILKGMELQNQEIAAIVNQRSVPDFQNTIVALDRSGSVLNRSLLALSNIEHATGDTVLMNTYAKLVPALSEHETSIMLNERLWDRIKQIYDRRDSDSSLTPEDKRLIEKTYLGFKHSGADLKGEDREKYRKLNAELSDLNVKFSQNVTNAMKDPERRMWLKESDLEGIPESIKSSYRAAAAEALAEEGKPDDASLYLVTIFRPSYAPFLTYSSRRDLREKLYRLNGGTNTSGEFNNLQILKDIANIRLEIARLMGKKNYAEYALEMTMAKKPETVMNFLGELNSAYTEPMRREIADITEYARKSEGKDFILEPWDYSYWSDKLKNERYAFNDEDLRPYFELNRTIDGVFGLATKLYGYKFKETSKIDKYHPDVRVYEVSDRNGRLLGVLYADFYYRPGKAPGAWMTEFRTESKDDNGNKTLPLISIVCNFSKPVGNNPVLLNADEVETFLHEFGHALHGLSSEAKYESLSGTNVDHDFVELFSQFNENFLTRKEYLDGFARHYKTGKKLPADLLDRFVKSARYGAAYSTMRQLGFGYLDMAYHTITEPLRASADIEAFESAAQDPVRVFPAVEGCIQSPSFGHIFSGGYAAGYYGYKWSEELDADAFAAFKENGIFDKKTADKFHKMLQAGDTVDPMELYVTFRGKKPSVDALLERDGIK